MKAVKFIKLQISKFRDFEFFYIVPTISFFFYIMLKSFESFKRSIKYLNNNRLFLKLIKFYITRKRKQRGKTF